MAISRKDLDPAFQGTGQKAGVEIWRIENFSPVLVPKSLHGKFFTGDSYVILKTTSLKSGGLRHDIHYWLGKDTSQDEAGVAAIKTVELDATLGGRAVQYRELQGHETEKFLSYFKPCIIPQKGGISSGFNHVEAEEYRTRLYVCNGKHVVHVNEVPFVRSSLTHDDIFILDTESKIFQFNGSHSSIQERAKALEVVQYIKDTNHDGKCEVAAIEDGRLMADAESGEFWGFFGGFAPLPRKSASTEDKTIETSSTSLFRVKNGQAERVEVETLTRDLLDTNDVYFLDCGLEVFVWVGKSTSLEERKSASKAAEEFVGELNRPSSHIIRVIEGFETVMFRSKFDLWPQSANVAVTEDGRGKVAALLKRQGVDVKGLVKADPAKEEPHPYIDCTGNLQVWRVNGDEKILLPAPDQSKFYSGNCYIYQYAYPGDDKEECLLGTWFGNQSVGEDRASAISQASKMVESLKFYPVQARLYEGKEPVQFFLIFQSFIVFKGGLSDAYKKNLTEAELPDKTYKEDGLALFRVQGSGPENMQSIQVEPVASSLNSSYCYILHHDSTVFTWLGTHTTSEDQELVERQLDLIKPDLQSKTHKEGVESDQFWELLGGKCEYPSQKLGRDTESDPHLFSCSYTKDDLKVSEIYNFNQDDLMAEDIFIVDCHTEIFVWVGQQVNSKTRVQALTIAENFLERDFLLENLARETPIYIVSEGSEPSFFTRFFMWDSSKSGMHGNSFERKLAILKHGAARSLEKPKRRTPISYGGRSASATVENSRARSMSSSPDRIRVRGRSPQFNALASTFENSSNTRNLSTPPPVVKKLYPRSSGLSESSDKVAPRSSAIAALTSTFERPQPGALIPRSRVGLGAAKEKPDTNSGENSMSSEIESLTNEEDVKGSDAEDEEGLIIHPYERLTTFSTDPVTDIDLTRREIYLSSQEFGEKFGMTKAEFHKLPKWKQNKIKMSLQLF